MQKRVPLNIIATPFRFQQKRTWIKQKKLCQQLEIAGKTEKYN